MSNELRTRDGLPFNFVDGLRIKGVDVTNWEKIFIDQGASYVGFQPVGNLAATNVQAAIAELENEKQSKSEPITTAINLRPGANQGIVWDNDAFGGTQDTASITLETASGEATKMRFTMTNDSDDNFEFTAKTADGLTAFNNAMTLNGNVLLNAANYVDYAAPMFIDYSTLRSYTGSATQARVVGNGVAGFFYYDTADTSSPDNGGTIIVSNNGKRWKRMFDGAVNVKWFGAVGDGVTYDTNAFTAATIAAGDGGAIIAPSGGTYAIDSGVSLNGTTLGVTLLSYGATILLATPSATISIGREASGIIGGTIQAVAAFTGNAITLTPMDRAAPAGRSFFLSDLNITCPTSTGKAISGHVTAADTRIVGLRSSNVSISGLEYGVYLNSAAPASVGFINDNAFVNLRIPGRTPRGIHLQASSTAANEVAGNTFTNLVTQYFSGVSVRHILVSDVRCKRNKFIGYDAWDIGGAATLLIEDLGLETQWFGTISTSGGVASFSSTAIGIINKDAGSQTAELMLGEYRRSQSVQNRKVQTFDTANLTTLDVRNGDVMIEGTVVSGTRLTNIVGAGSGQEITIQFSGNTLLSNAWGGTGQIFTRDRISRTPAAGEVVALVYIGAAWYEIAQSEGIPVSVPASSIAAAANAINTTGKFNGRTIWDSTNNRALRASGSTATSVWWVVDGSASVTPV